MNLIKYVTTVCLVYLTAVATLQAQPEPDSRLYISVEQYYADVQNPWRKDLNCRKFSNH